MRRGDHLLAWAISEQALASRDPLTRDDPTLSYHLRWVWDGTPPDGKHVLVRCYHGLGDTLQFARYLPELARRAASVTLEITPRLHCLLCTFPCTIVAFDPAHPLPSSECDIEIMELGFALRIPPAELAEPWFKTDAFTLPEGTVALCTRAGDWDPLRSIPEAELASLFDHFPIFSMDIGPTSLRTLNPGGCPEDLAATAALLAGCETVVTVDTMIAHLAGAMGKRTLLMLRHEPDWRWNPESRRSDWYPSLRLFTQPEPAAWAPVVAEIMAELSR